jgi:hypothetical protein
MPYTEEQQKEITILLTTFFNEERNNRLTPFNFNGLLSMFSQIFNKKESVPKDEDPEST